MKVFHINSYYSYYGKVGFYKKLFDQQVLNGLDISVYVPLDYSIDTKENDFGEYTKIVKTHTAIDRYFFHLKEKKMLKKAMQYYSIQSYDIMHAHSLFSNGYIAYKLNKKFGIPYIVAVRDSDINIFFKKMIHLRRLGNKILSNASKVIFLSETYKKEMFDKYILEKYKESISNKVEIIPNGLDPFWLNNRGQEKTIKFEKAINIIFVGHVSKRKNLTITMQACKKLKEKGYKVKFTVVGPVDEKEILNKINSYDFTEYIEPQPKERLIELYRQNDIFVMPSIRETFGLVYAEAMSQGLPVVYTRGQGFDQQFKEGEVGYNVDCNDAEEVMKKIIKIESKYSQISKNCIKMCEKFDWNIICNQYIKIYNELIN